MLVGMAVKIIFGAQMYKSMMLAFGFNRTTKLIKYSLYRKLNSKEVI